MQAQRLGSAGTHPSSMVVSGRTRKVRDPIRLGSTLRDMLASVFARADLYPRTELASDGKIWIKVPLLSVVGRKDPICLAAFASRQAESVSDFTLQELGCGHWIMDECSTEL